MPRRVITAPGHSRKRSLGWLAVWWIETFTVHGPGGVVGQAVRFTDEDTGFIVDSYALDDSGRRLYDSAFLSRPKGCDKSGKAAKIALFEAFGPARFDGWARGGEKFEYLGRTYTYAAGEPMGRVITSPYVRVLATEEEQTGNTYATIHWNLTSSEAPLFELQAWGVIAGKSEVAIPGGGIIKRSTSGSSSKDGGQETFVVFDETHLYVTPQLRAMYAVVADNLGKRALDAEPWFLETTTMFGPGEGSIAEETYKYADAIEEGRARKPRLLFDHRWGEVKDIRDEKALRAGFADAYGDAIAWNPIDGLVEKAYDPRRTEARTRRMRLNALTDSTLAWMPVEAWRARGVSRLRSVAKAARAVWDFVRPWDRDEITLGFDGARTNDSTALIACRVRDRYLFPLLIEEVPDGPEADGWEVDSAKVDAAVFRAFEKYRVVGFYADPPYWQDHVTEWDLEYGEQLQVHASQKNSLAFWTKRDTEMSNALEALHTAVVTGAVMHDDESELGKAMTRHFLNARRWERRGGTVIGKEGKNSPRKIDAAVAATLAFKAAADYAAKGGTPAAPATAIPERVR